jgi:hypothetical protein
MSAVQITEMFLKSLESKGPQEALAANLIRGQRETIKFLKEALEVSEKKVIDQHLEIKRLATSIRDLKSVRS